MLSLQLHWLKPSDYTGNDCKTFNHPTASTAKETINLRHIVLKDQWRFIRWGKWKSTQPSPSRVESWPGHLLVRFLSHSKYVRVHVPHVLPAVGVDDLLAVDLELLVRVDGHQHNACKDAAHTHGLHSLVDRFIPAEFTDRLKTRCSYRTWAKYIFANVGSCHSQKMFTGWHDKNWIFS